MRECDFAVVMLAWEKIAGCVVEKEGDKENRCAHGEVCYEAEGVLIDHCGAAVSAFGKQSRMRVGDTEEGGEVGRGGLRRALCFRLQGAGSVLYIKARALSST